MKSFEKPKRLLRKVSVIISDPDATDDSSSDECSALTTPTPRKVKRIVHEITFLSEESEITEDRCNGVKTSRKKSPRQGKYPVGVRPRPSGRYAAEIMNPITKTKKWLGTYETTEEAAKAYVDKKAEYKTLASSRTGGLCANQKDIVAATGDSNKDLSVDLDFSSLQIPDLSSLAVGGGKDPMVSKPNGAELDFDSFLSSEYDHLLNDYSLLDDGLNISGFENSIPNELPDYDFTDMDLELGDFEVCLC